MGYINGQNVYQFVGSEPADAVDPTGLDYGYASENGGMGVVVGSGGLAGTTPPPPGVVAGSPTTAPSTPAVLDGPLSGLGHYLGGSGATATLGSELVSSLQKMAWYQYLINETIRSKFLAQIPSQPNVAKHQISFTGNFDGPTAPIQGDPATGNLGREDFYSFALNNTLGTAHGTWSATADVWSTAPDAQGKYTAYVSNIQIHASLNKLYNFDNYWWNRYTFGAVFRYWLGLGVRYHIQNDWNDSAPGASVTRCVGTAVLPIAPTQPESFWMWLSKKLSGNITPGY